MLEILLRSEKNIIHCSSDSSAQDAAETSFSPPASTNLEPIGRARIVEVLRRVFADQREHQKEAGRIESDGKNERGCLGKIDSLVAEGVTSIWTTLDESLRDWRTAVVAQQDQLASLKSNVK